MREGRSYCTRAVRAQQNGKIIFIMLCSFQRPEPWQVSTHLPPPPNVPRPDQCEYVYEAAEKVANNPDVDPRVQSHFLDYVSVGLLWCSPPMEGELTGL